jgi:hypothetical protein
MRVVFSCCPMIWIGGDMSADGGIPPFGFAKGGLFSQRRREIDFLKRAFSWGNALLELVIFQISKWSVVSGPRNRPSA